MATKKKTKKASSNSKDKKPKAKAKVKRVKKAPAKPKPEPFDPEVENKGGRPTLLTKEIADYICLSLAEGTSLRTICSLPGVPAKSTVLGWLLIPESQWFLDQYTRARAIQTDVLFDETLDIADDGSNDYYDKQLPGGDTIRVVDSEHIQRSKLRVDTRLKFAAQVAPKKYHPRQILTDPDGNSPTDALSQLLAEVTGQAKGFKTNGNRKKD